MNKGEFLITENNSTYCFTFPEKKYLKEIFNKLFDDISSLSFYVSNYNGSNTYFGDNYWEKHGVIFEKGDKEGTYIFRGSEINFILNDKIDTIDIAICRGKNPVKDKCSEIIKIKHDKTLSIFTQDYNFIIKCLVFHIQNSLFFDFSKRYDENKLFNFLKNENIDLTGKGQLFIKSLKLKKGINFKLSIQKKKNKQLFYDINFKNNKWNLQKIGGTDDNEKLKKFPMLEKINYFYVSVFFLIVISGILLIATPLRFNIIIFAFAILLFFSCLKYIYKKVKVLIGFKMAVKPNES